MQSRKKGKKFTNFIDIIKSDDNLLLAYRNVKKNKGSKTVGTDKKNISYIENMGSETYLKRMKNKIDNYHPKSVRRVEILKLNGKTRPLGIPCIEDRLIQ